LYWAYKLYDELVGAAGEQMYEMLRRESRRGLFLASNSVPVHIPVFPQLLVETGGKWMECLKMKIGIAK